MKKVKSSIKKSDIKSFVLGIALAVVISFGVTGVLAINEQPGVGGAQGGDETKDVYKFIGQEGGLVNRIGSLTVGQYDDASWILSSANKCMTQDASDSEVQSCLNVIGSGAFSKLTVLDMPTFIQGSSLFLNESGSGSILSGLPTGLVIDDFVGVADSIMTSSLQYEVGGEIALRNLEEQREVCADSTTGRLQICGEDGSQDYHWEINTNEWTGCENHALGDCSGTYTSDGGGSCTETYSTYICNGDWTEKLKIDHLGNHLSWIVGIKYDWDGNQAEWGEYPRFKVDGDDSRWWMKVRGLASWDRTASFTYDYVTHGCDDRNPTSETSCLRNNSENGNACSWDGTTDQCSNLSGMNSDTCDDSPHESCVWRIDAGTTEQCSDLTLEVPCKQAGGSEECTWYFPTGVQYNTLVCKNDSGTTVNDSYCDGVQEPQLPSRDCKEDAVCGDRDPGSNLTAYCDPGVCQFNGAGCETCSGFAEAGCNTEHENNPDCVGDPDYCAG